MRTLIVLSALVLATSVAAGNRSQPRSEPQLVAQLEQPTPSRGVPAWHGPADAERRVAQPGRVLRPTPTREATAASDPGEFVRAYQQQGMPRIAVFLNRKLSDEVDEWRGQIRGISEHGGVAKAAKKGDVDASTGDELWRWHFEDGFMAPLLSVGTLLVDRAVLVRLTLASREGASGDIFDSSDFRGSAYDNQANSSQAEAARAEAAMQGLLDFMNVETTALVDYADVVVELLVRRAAGTPMGYEFRATAKQVRTGILLASVSSSRWSDAPAAAAESFVATPEGYRSTHDTAGIPQVGHVSGRLAEELMAQLARSWALHASAAPAVE